MVLVFPHLLPCEGIVSCKSIVFVSHAICPALLSCHTHVKYEAIATIMSERFCAQQRQYSLGNLTCHSC